MRVYISGPMTGLPEFNRPAFHACATIVRSLGHEALSPAENPAPACGTWRGWMRLAIAQLAGADCVIVLDGWRRSRGARLEVLIAEWIGIPVYYSLDQIRSAIFQSETKER